MDDETDTASTTSDASSGAPSLDDVVRALSADVGSLESVVRAVVGAKGARLTDWQVAPLAGGSGNSTSAGIFRVSGDVHLDGDHPAPWSAVLKIVRSPVETGAPWDSPTDVFYWRREVEIFGSHLLDDVQGVATPQCFDVVDLPEATAWLWLEDLGAIARSEWNRETYQVAARALARFHAPYLTGSPIPHAPWLVPDLPRRFHALCAPFIGGLLTRARGGSPAYAPVDPARAKPDMAALLRIVTHPEPLMAAAAAAPQTLCHHDACIDNLQVRPGSHGTPELVAFDWQMMGPGSIGSDLGQLLCYLPAARDTATNSAEEDPETAVLRAYQEELALAGVEIGLDAVRRAYVAEAALRQITFAVALLALELDRSINGDGDAPVPADGADADGPVAAEVIARFVESTSASHLSALARQALDLFYP